MWSIHMKMLKRLFACTGCLQEKYLVPHDSIFYFTLSGCWNYFLARDNTIMCGVKLVKEECPQMANNVK